ncbi:MAG TPA: c-type cytochrome, partial [Terriglobia bacterium]|nr:c-type cytochrome [Terriglobia bacterium]
MQVLLLAGTVLAAQQRLVPSSREASPLRGMVEQHCVGCHNSQVKNGGLDLESIRLDDVAQYPDVWERVVRKLRAGQMPPVGMKRPEESTYRTVVAWLSESLDKASAGHPNPGRTDTFRRLTRTEYQ